MQPVSAPMGPSLGKLVRKDEKISWGSEFVSLYLSVVTLEPGFHFMVGKGQDTLLNPYIPRYTLGAADSLAMVLVTQPAPVMMGAPLQW